MKRIITAICLLLSLTTTYADDFTPIVLEIGMDFEYFSFTNGHKYGASDIQLTKIGKRNLGVGFHANYYINQHFGIGATAMSYPTGYGNDRFKIDMMGLGYDIHFIKKDRQAFPSHSSYTFGPIFRLPFNRLILKASAQIGGMSPAGYRRTIIARQNESNKIRTLSQRAVHKSHFAFVPMVCLEYRTSSCIALSLNFSYLFSGKSYLYTDLLDSYDGAVIEHHSVPLGLSNWRLGAGVSFRLPTIREIKATPLPADK